jgi:hypothetical protein
VPTLGSYLGTELKELAHHAHSIGSQAATVSMRECWAALRAHYSFLTVSDRVIAVATPADVGEAVPLFRQGAVCVGVSRRNPQFSVDS